MLCIPPKVRAAVAQDAEVSGKVLTIGLQICWIRQHTLMDRYKLFFNLLGSR